jgi:ABC-type transporter Mla subunit MlaD
MAGWDWRGPTVDWATHAQLDRIEQKVDTLMANLDALKAASDQITADVASAISELNDLSQRVASGGDVSQADIDAVTASLASAHDQLTQAVAADAPAAPATGDPGTITEPGGGTPTDVPVPPADETATASGDGTTPPVASDPANPPAADGTTGNAPTGA